MMDLKPHASELVKPHHYLITLSQKLSMSDAQLHRERYIKKARGFGRASYCSHVRRQRQVLWERNLDPVEREAVNEHGVANSKQVASAFPPGHGSGNDKGKGKVAERSREDDDKEDGGQNQDRPGPDDNESDDVHSGNHEKSLSQKDI